MGYRKYDSDFKREAVRMVAEVREVERNLGITFGVLKGWVEKHREHQDAAFAGRLALGSPEAELAGIMPGAKLERASVSAKIRCCWLR